MTQELNNSSEDVSAFEDLKRRAQITKKIRFQASERLEKRQTLSYLAISLLSLFVILISLIPNIVELSEGEKQILLMLTILNTVFIIITTSLDAFGKFVHKCDQLHRSARMVAGVYSKLLLLSDEQREEREIVRRLQEEYQLALDECAFNHERSDYFRLKIEEPELFSDEGYRRERIWFLRDLRMLACSIREVAWLAPHAIVVTLSVIIVWDMISLSAFF